MNIVINKKIFTNIDTFMLDKDEGITDIYLYSNGKKQKIRYNEKDRLFITAIHGLVG